MAYQYDEMGNVIGEYESEEERRLREAANQPVKQTTVYNPDGTSEVTIKGTPEALSSANPNTPTVTGPVSPDETYKRMLQAESGNKNFLPNGQPVTSPKGAMFASQVMPATAAQPGYGIRPASSQTPEEYNRVGQEYYQAMLKQFGGDTQKAAAAYNAGPGRVQQNIQQNQGQMNVAQLPRETQGYLQKIGQTVGNMIPSAQASTLPVNPAAMPAQPPQPAPQSTFQGQTDEFGGMEERSKYALGTGQGNQGIQTPAIGQAPTAGPIFDFYQKFQDNPRALISMAFTNEKVGVPDWMRERMKNRASELITQQRELEKAKGEIPTMTESEIAKTLREKTTGGNYLKAALFGMLGMENSAMAEAAKLGVGKETMTMINGQPAMVKMAANGTPIEGYNATTGKKLTAEELVMAAQYATAQKGAQTHTGKMQDMRTGEVYYERTTPQGIELVDNNGKKYTGPSQNLRPFGIGSDIQTKNQIQVNELTNKLAFAGPTERARIVAENEAKYGPLDPGVKQQALGSVTGAVPTQQTQQPANLTPQQANQPAQAATQASAQQAAQSTQQPALTLAQREAQQKGRDEVMKKAGDVVADSAKIVSDITNIDRAANEALTKKNNFGTIISGMIPGEQTFGELFKTQDHINTMNVLEQVNKQAAINARMLGVNPTDRDLQFVVSTKPDITWSQEAVADWLKKSVEGTRRTLDFARKQMETGGTYVPPTPQPDAGQFKIISVEPGKK